MLRGIRGRTPGREELRILSSAGLNLDVLRGKHTGRMSYPPASEQGTPYAKSEVVVFVGPLLRFHGMCGRHCELFKVAV